MQKQFLWALVGALALTVSGLRPANAAVPALSNRKDIGEPSGTGETKGPDANGVWTITGGGADIWGQSDQFQYAYDLVKGDTTITARFKAMDVIGHAEWTKIGLMIRESDAADSPNAFLDMTSGHGMQFQLRDVAATDTKFSSNVAGSFKTDGPSEAWMRLQRVGNTISYYHGQDGKNWYAAAPTQTIPTLKEEALVGIANTSHDDPNTATATFDNVDIRPGAALVHGIKACGGDKAGLLEWQPLAGAVSYNIYRAPAGTTDSTKFVQVNPTDTPLVGTTYTDTSAGLENATEVLYAIAPVSKGTDGNPVEGDRVIVPLTPNTFGGNVPPAGFAVSSIKEAFACGVGAQVDSATGVITIRGAGGDIWNKADEFNFTQQEVTGDFQVQVQVLSRPTRTNEWAKAGLMIREGLSADARNVNLLLTPDHGLNLQWRTETAGDPGGSGSIDQDTVVTPSFIRMTRKGSDVTAEYSVDGKTWEQVGDVFTFDPPLPDKVNVGLAITSHDAGKISEATFKDLKITQPVP
jgi:regulation of enolase protein 1 (concanavalin A-like superfamily)